MLKRPSSEEILEYLSMPGEISLAQKYKVKVWTSFDAKSRKASQRMAEQLRKMTIPEPEVMDSILKVYQRLQNDETLILGGWKIKKMGRDSGPHQASFFKTWAFQGGIGFTLFSLLFLVGQESFNKKEMAGPAAIPQKDSVAQIRLEEHNQVKVHYIQPELLQTVEFETSR